MYGGGGLFPFIGGGDVNPEDFWGGAFAFPLNSCHHK